VNAEGTAVCLRGPATTAKIGHFPPPPLRRFHIANDDFVVSPEIRSGGASYHGEKKEQDRKLTGRLIRRFVENIPPEIPFFVT
jgi:hypothetical protein